MTYEAIPAVQYTDSHGDTYTFAAQGSYLLETIPQSETRWPPSAAMFVQPLVDALVDERPYYLSADAYEFRAQWMASPAAELPLAEAFAQAAKSNPDVRRWHSNFGLRYHLQSPIIARREGRPESERGQ